MIKEEDVWKVLDILYEENEEAVRRWIYHKWPHGIGLYD